MGVNVGINHASSKLLDLILGVSPDQVLNSGAHIPRLELPAQGLLKAGRKVLEAGLDDASGDLDYLNLQDHPAYSAYRELARSLQSVSPASLTSATDQWAFWINLYNALMIDAVLQYGVKKSVMRDPGIFRRAAYNVGGLRYSANDIEHGILRRNRPHPYLRMKPFSDDDPRLKFMVPVLDPRIHFTLVCAANSCPPISFYSGDRLDEQLDLATRAFMNAGGFRMDPDTGTLYLSRIFAWYRDDFGGKKRLRAWLKPWLEGSEAIHAKLKIRYLRYDWGLNQVVRGK